MKNIWYHQHRRVWRQWVSCFASLALLASVLMPSISFAFSQQNGVPFNFNSEICSTAKGLKNLPGKMSLTISGKISKSTESKHLKHCNLCLSHVPQIDLAMSDTPARLPHCEVDHFPALFYQAPSLSQTWIAANPRAPPQSL